jgi:thiosulfate reductase cytochrome b subunit
MDAPQPLYALHERVWHWLQASAFLLLLLTGFAIHYPDRFAILGSFSRAVSWHSWLGLFLILNAFLGVFYHLTAERYHHYLPRMDDFTSGAFRQARFYLYGIFHGEPHPMETDPRKKLNPLQKITYLALLGILLPVQIVSGILMWGATRWPGLLERAGGLGVLAPLHTLGAFLFLSFLIGHVYLATAGDSPLALFKAMVTGHLPQKEAASRDSVVAMPEEADLPVPQEDTQGES